MSDGLVAPAGDKLIHANESLLLRLECRGAVNEPCPGQMCSCHGAVVTVSGHVWIAASWSTQEVINVGGAQWAGWGPFHAQLRVTGTAADNDLTDSYGRGDR